MHRTPNQVIRCVCVSASTKAYTDNKAKEKWSYQTLEMVSAGLHCSLRISRHMLPLLLMFGWKTFVLKAT
jgi:hypothetical protein